MKAMILNGMLANDGAQVRPVQAALEIELQNQGWEVQTFVLHQMEIAPCAGCFGCWLKTPGQCVLPQSGEEIARAVIQNDLLVLLTPVTFGGYSSELKKALDHCICNVLPYFTQVKGETHHKHRYQHYQRLLGVGVLAQDDAASERIFASLVERNAINFWAPVHAAGVISGTPSAEQLQVQVQNLLSQVEVI